MGYPGARGYSLVHRPAPVPQAEMNTPEPTRADRRQTSGKGVRSWFPPWFRERVGGPPMLGNAAGFREASEASEASVVVCDVNVEQLFEDRALFDGQVE